MAYTYDDFLKAASDAGLSNSFNQSDLDLAQKYPDFGMGLVGLMRDAAQAQTDEQRLLATEAANQLRKNYGQYGVGTGSDRSYAASWGSQIDQALKDIGSYGEFEYQDENKYRELLDQVTNREAFSYDPENDPLYSSYKKAYNREGDRAAANALGAAAAATGGRVSSFASTAAQQANNYYSGKLADALPTLRSQALNEYNNETAQLLQALSASSTDRNTAYQTYLDRLSQMQQNLKNLQGQDETEYKRFLDELNAEYQRERDAIGDARQNLQDALDVYAATGQITGALADYLGMGGTAGTGGAVSSGGGGWYGGGSGSSSGLSAEDEARLGDIMDRNPDGFITKWDDYSALRELSGMSDAELNAMGWRYGYPTETGTDGQQRPATFNDLRDVIENNQKNLGGTLNAPWPETVESYDAKAGNYATYNDIAETMRQGGATKSEIQAELQRAWKAGDLNLNDYTSLVNKFRNMPASSFGTGAGTRRTQSEYEALLEQAAREKAAAEAAAAAAAQRTVPQVGSYAESLRPTESQQKAQQASGAKNPNRAARNTPDNLLRP